MTQPQTQCQGRSSNLWLRLNFKLCASTELRRVTPVKRMLRHRLCACQHVAHASRMQHASSSCLSDRSSNCMLWHTFASSKSAAYAHTGSRRRLGCSATVAVLQRAEARYRGLGDGTLPWPRASDVCPCRWQPCSTATLFYA